MMQRLTEALKYIVTQVVWQVVLPLIVLVIGLFIFAAALKDPETFGRIGMVLIKILRAFLERA